jgi:hypothetical protein
MTKLHMRFEMSTEVKMYISVIWVMTPCSLVGGYQRFWRNAASIFISALKMEVVCPYETMITIYRNTRCHREEHWVFVLKLFDSNFGLDVDYLESFLNFPQCNSKHLVMQFKQATTAFVRIRVYSPFLIYLLIRHYLEFCVKTVSLNIINLY